MTNARGFSTHLDPVLRVHIVAPVGFKFKVVDPTRGPWPGILLSSLLVSIDYSQVIPNLCHGEGFVRG